LRGGGKTSIKCSHYSTPVLSPPRPAGVAFLLTAAGDTLLLYPEADASARAIARQV
jgi:hypothetical protein